MKRPLFLILFFTILIISAYGVSAANNTVVRATTTGKEFIKIEFKEEAGEKEEILKSYPFLDRCENVDCHGLYTYQIELQNKAQLFIAAYYSDLSCLKSTYGCPVDIYFGQGKDRKKLLYTYALTVDTPTYLAADGSSILMCRSRTDGDVGADVYREEWKLEGKETVKTTFQYKDDKAFLPCLPAEN